MPTSRSPQRGVKTPAAAASPRFVRPFILIVVLAVMVVIVIALPASLVKRFLPPSVVVEDLSGSLWHGSAGKITANARDLGAAEWRLHPWSLLRLMLSADVRWVKVGFVVDGTADVTRDGVTLRNIQGGGPIEDLGDLGMAPGWRGTAGFKVGEIKVGFANGAAVLASVVGDATVSNLSSSQIADGADLGGYALHAADGAIAPNSDATAELSDTGGPLEAAAVIRLSADGHTATLSGTLKERSNAPPALLNQLNNLTQLHARDAQGRIPVDLEFTL